MFDWQFIQQYLSLSGSKNLSHLSHVVLDWSGRSGLMVMIRQLLRSRKFPILQLSAGHTLSPQSNLWCPYGIGGSDIAHRKIDIKHSTLSGLAGILECLTNALTEHSFRNALVVTAGA